MGRPISKNPSLLKPINDVYLRLLQLMPETVAIENSFLDKISNDDVLIDKKKKGVIDEHRIKEY